jgi:2-oxoisovalerate dehydrogenase E1 component
MLRTCIAAASVDGSASVFLEPIALYHTRDLFGEGDVGWAAPYPAPSDWSVCHAPIGSARVHGDGHDLTIVTFANGVYMALRVARRLAADGIAARVLDMRWLVPLPAADIVREAEATGRVLIVDETRRSGGVSEGIVSALVDANFDGTIRRVTSQDSFIPLGEAANHVLVQEGEIEAAARLLVGSVDGREPLETTLQATGTSEMSSRTSAEGSRASI